MTTPLTIEPYADASREEWEELVGRAPMATFLHRRRFLDYHGDRFEDASAIVRDARGRCAAVFPAARDPAIPARVSSHVGATYGGLIHAGTLGASGSLEAVELLAAHYASLGFRELRYKAVPWIYGRAPFDEDVYALWRSGAVLARCDLSVAFRLDSRRRASGGRRDSIRKARAAGVLASRDDAALEEMWPVLEANLSERHAVAPTHRLEEIEELKRRFHDEIAIVAGRIEGRLVAGAVLFLMHPVVHLQYTCTSDEGRRHGALDAVLEHSIGLAAQDGAMIFDFGISTEREGTVLNEGLHFYKQTFGGGGLVYPTFDLTL
jgi:hypothetical protein